jgi:hypothetical protein
MKLKKSVEFLGKTYSELNFSEPNGVIISECGVPMKPGGADGSEMNIDTKAVHRLMARCADVPIEVIDMLSPADWMAGMAVVSGFFGDTAVEAPPS